MAKLPPNNPLSGASGRIGSVVVYMSNGIQIVRSLPGRGKKRKPTNLQLLHINSFKAQHAFARSIKQSIIDRVWSKLVIPVGMNPYNYFIKSNSDAFGKTDHIEFPQLITLSNGKLLPVEDLKVDITNNKLSLSWNSSENNTHASATDRLTIAILINKKNLQIFDSGFVRSDEKAELELSDLNQDITEGFIFLSSTNDKMFSRSEYWHWRK